MTDTTPPAPILSTAARIGLFAGVAALLATLLLPPPAGLPEAGWHTLGLALMMAVWWSTEPVPMGITALLPILVLPLIGVLPVGAATAPYANPLVFLFLGGFLLAAGVERCGLHRRLAHGTVRVIGTEPRRLVLGFMIASGFLSMWLSNTATVVLLLPVAVSVIGAMEEARGQDAAGRRFALALLLGLAYAASIGGMGTLIGSPPNALFAGYLAEQHRVDVSFALWSAVALPLVAVFLPLAWLVLTRLVFPIAPGLAAAAGGAELIDRLHSGAPMSTAERRVGAVFLVAAVLWIARPLLNRIAGLEGLSDPAIGLACASALFLIPAGTGEARFLMSWREAQHIPWQVLILFGGGLSLAAAMDASGLAVWLGGAFGDLGRLPPWLFAALLIATVVLLTELMSNTAAVAALLPVIGAIAAATGADVVALGAAVTLAASCAFMMPVATPPNALVFATGHLRVASMMRAGLLMNLLSVLLVSLAAVVLVPLLTGGG